MPKPRNAIFSLLKDHQPHHKVAHQFRMNTLTLHRTTTTTTPPYLAREMSRNGKNQKCHPSFFTFFLLKDQLHQQGSRRASCEHSNPPPPDHHHHHPIRIQRHQEMPRARTHPSFSHPSCSEINYINEPATTNPSLYSYEARTQPDHHRHHHATLSGSRDIKKCQEPEIPSIIFTSFLLKYQLHQRAQHQKN